MASQERRYVSPTKPGTSADPARLRRQQRFFTAYVNSKLGKRDDVNEDILVHKGTKSYSPKHASYPMSLPQRSHTKACPHRNHALGATQVDFFWSMAPALLQEHLY